MKQLLLIAFAFCLFTTSNAQVTVNGVTLPSKLKTTTSELTLNGAGVRKKAFFKVYVLGLYLQAKSTDAVSILKSDKDMAVRLQITSSVVNSDNMSEAIHEGFTKSLGGNTAPLKSKIDNFISIFSKEKIKEGDVFILDYTKEIGVKSYKNGKLLATIAGEDFKDALFGIWLGANPIDSGLKTSILGK
ncbi:MAG: chalcone isomerase family protein [Chitinophagales bacterium]|nr:chalcone isomerase family protein [Chitinophagales bacterium]MBP6153340.1 chalcone isomerase family protein [Chitinophagales bacterium]